MSISIKKPNLAGQSYFHDCTGTIALDTAGSHFFPIIRSKVEKYIQGGYSITGFRFSTKNLHDIDSNLEVNVDIVLTKDDQNFCVTREVNILAL